MNNYAELKRLLSDPDKLGVVKTVNTTTMVISLDGVLTTYPRQDGFNVGDDVVLTGGRILLSPPIVATMVFEV
jgi:hypothetical protein